MLNQRAWKKAIVRYFSIPPGVNVNHSSQLRVVSTNQWPIPYYQRSASIPRSLYPEGDYNISLTGNEVHKPDDNLVFLTHQLLNETMWGREILDTMHSMNLKGCLNTVIASPIRSANAYTEDLLRHIDFALKENAKILKKHKLSDIFNE